MLLPNGILAFRCADGFHFDLEAMVLAGETIRPFPCPAGSAAMRPPAGSPLEADDLRAELPGYTFCQDPTTNFPDVFGGRLAMFVAADGTLYGRLTRRPDGDTRDDVGHWHITPAGQLCRVWHTWDQRRECCYMLRRSRSVPDRGDDAFEFTVTECWDIGLYRRVPGNPEGY